MKTRPTLLLFCAFALAATALTNASAEAAASPTQIRDDNELLGRLDAALVSCARVDAKNRATYQQYHKQLIGFGEGEQMVVLEASKTPEYRSAYQALIVEFDALPQTDASAQCARFIGALE